jgi:class 3 adenylate cyclase
MSILFAATYPDRVSALILGAATARYRPAPGYPCGQGSEAMFASLTEIAERRWGQGASIDWFLPSRADSSHARRLFARFERMSITPSAFLRIVRMIRDIDVREVLPTIHVPTLVIQRLDDRMTTPCQAIRCAHTIRASSTAAGIEPCAGVHTGEVELRRGAIGGLSVDVAAAIAALARPGEILVSRTVTDLVIGSGISFADRGTHALSGIPDRWPLFAVTAV